MTVGSTSALNLFTVIRIVDNASVGSVLTGLWALAVLLPTLAVMVQRLRDAGLGWPHLLWILVPVAGIILLLVLLALPSKATVGTAPA